MGAAAVAAVLVTTPLAAQSGGGGLSVRVSDEWIPWAAGSERPTRWNGPDPVLTAAIEWTNEARGVDVGELSLRGGNTFWKLRIILVRVDPAAVDFQVVVPPRDPDGFAGRWSADEAPPDALVAVNAGQFTGPPWGWLVSEGRTVQPPGTGPLAPGFAVGSDGSVAILPRDSLAGSTGVQEGFQSYPALLAGDGDVPLPLRSSGLGVDLTHRDGRLALGILRDGRVLLALTRYEGLGGMLEVVPFGPTTPEMAALMGGLGCRRAVLLDGGISGQMMVNGKNGRRTWPGLRKVAAGLVVVGRGAGR